MCEDVHPNTGQRVWIELPPLLREGEKPLVLVTQDEAIFYLNDTQRGTWQSHDGMGNEKAGHGERVHASGYVASGWIFG